MTFVVHSSWVERNHDGAEPVDLDGAGAVTVNLGIVTEAVIDPDTNSLYSGLTAVGTATGWTGPVAIGSLICGLDGSSDLVFDGADPTQIAQDAGGFTTGRSIVAYLATSSRIIAHHTDPSVFGNDAGPINISWPNGIWKATI